MKVEHEKILKREDGTRVKIAVHFISDHRRSGYKVTVSHCDKGKRTWRGCCNTNTYEHRSLSMEDRIKAVEKSALGYATYQEISAVKLELWELMKPEAKGE